MGATFETIPPDVVKALISLLEPSSWKVLRLVNKVLASHVTPLIFRDVEVWIETQSLTNLLSIARSNDLAPYVQTLTITNNYLHTQILSPRSMISAIYLGIFTPHGTSRGPGWIDAAAAQYVSIESFVESDIPERLTSLGWDRERVFKAWTMQKELVMQQDELIRNSLDVEYLAEAFGSLLNLACVKLTCNGIGEARILSTNRRKDIFFRSPTIRTDGRQLFSFFRAAAATSASNPNQNFKLATLIMDKYFWEGEYYCLPGQYTGPPDLGNLDPNTLVAALPFLGAITTLELQTQYQKDYYDVPIIEQNLATLFSGIPNLQNLTLHNPNEVIPLRMHTPINAITSSSCCAINLQHCVLHLESMEVFIRKQSRTLKVLRLEKISLEAGHIVDFFTTIRVLLSLDTFSLKGWLLEVQDDTRLYFLEEEIDDETFYEVKERRNSAREAIEKFLRRETNVFPTELLDVDSSGFTDYSRGGNRGGMIVVIGASQLYDSHEVDF